jgi:hypothetical protein
MSRTKKTATQPRRRHAPEFKVEALALAEQIGAVDAFRGHRQQCGEYDEVLGRVDVACL